jgi:hypothetical protein
MGLLVALGVFLLGPRAAPLRLICIAPIVGGVEGV